MPPLSDEVLLRVLAEVDQETRVNCGLVSARLHALLQSPDAWRSAVAYVLNARALCFLERVRPETLKLLTSNPVDLAWFVEGLVANGCHSHVRDLTIDLHLVSFPERHAVMDHVAEFSRLERLLVISRPPVSPSPACLAIPHGHSGLRNLQELSCVALGNTDEEESMLEVYLDGACLPSLESAHVRAASSDILACARRFPRLHTLVYTPTRDTLEDAQLAGMSLRVLKIGVPCAVAARFCMPALASLLYVEHVKLFSSVPLVWDSHVNLHDLTIVMRPGESGVELVYTAVRHIASVNIECLSDQGVSGWVAPPGHAGFQAWCMKSLRVGQGCKVIIRL